MQASSEDGSSRRRGPLAWSPGSPSCSPRRPEARREPGGLALVAVGGQGRRELAPQSDLDLLLLFEGGGAPTEVAEALWYPIWDEGLKLGHAVRSVRDTLSLASSDLDTATSLLSVRHICGDEALSVELAERAGTNWRRRGRGWIERLATSVEQRHRDAGEVAFALEPDLKEARGGLRDVHALSWAVAAGAQPAGSPLVGLREEHDVLFEVRVELHRVQGRPGDTLVLQEQDAVAARLGDADADALMARVAAAGRRIAISSDEAWYDMASRVRSRSARDRVMGETCVRGNRVSLTDEMRPPRDPFAMLDVAVAAAREGKRISHTTLNALVGAPRPPEEWPDDARGRLVELLLTGHGSTAVIEVLQLRGLWTRLLPEWHPAICRPQRNAFHRYTVDRHLLETAAVASELTHLVPRPDLLVIAALLHDIGKAYPELGDHSQQGARIAEGMARRMGFPSTDVATISCLVEHHLLMADVATRRDLEDPATAELVAASWPPRSGWRCCTP
ncbi:MAG: HD domain-containing protein [Microthrixaceae bacterium]|nr:HD domain-containing protein [Microthrixaceae bacterium]